VTGGCAGELQWQSDEVGQPWLRLRHGVSVEEREREIMVRVCVEKEMMTWQTLIGDWS